MDEFTELLRTVARGRSLTRRQLRLAIRRRGFVRLWAPDGTLIDDWHAMVAKGVSQAELTPRGNKAWDKARDRYRLDSYGYTAEEVADAEQED